MTLPPYPRAVEDGWNWMFRRQGNVMDEVRPAGANALVLRGDDGGGGVSLSRGDPGRLLLDVWAGNSRMVNNLDRESAKMIRDYITAWLAQ